MKKLFYGSRRQGLILSRKTVLEMTEPKMIISGKSVFFMSLDVKNPSIIMPIIGISLMLHLLLR